MVHFSQRVMSAGGTLDSGPTRPVQGLSLAILAAFAGFACAVTGCVELKEGSDESPLASDELRALGLMDPQWSCLDSPVTIPAPSQAARVSFSMPIVESISELPPAGLQVTACQLLDVACLAPVTASPVGPSEDGLVHLSLPRGFEGFLEIISDETAPALFFLHEPLERDLVVEPLPLISELGLSVLASNNGTELDLETRGLVVIRTYDCLAQPAAGVALSNDRGGQVFMFVEGLPRVGITVTDVAGLGGFMNVPPGFTRITGTHVGTGEVSGAESLVVRPKWLTFGDLHPIDSE